MLIAEKLTTHIQAAHQKRIGNGIGTMLKVKLGSKIQYIVCYNGTGEKRVQKCIRFFVWRFLPVSLRRVFTLNHRPP